VGNIAREEALRHADLRREQDQKEYNDYREYYEEVAKAEKRRRGEAEAEAQQLREEVARLKAAQPQAPTASGGAGGAAASAGRDATINQHVNYIHVNLYGEENFNPASYPGLLPGLVSKVTEAIAEGKTEDEIRSRLLTMGMGNMLRRKENRTLQGWNRGMDTLGVHEGGGIFEQRATREVAKKYAKQVGKAMGDADPVLSMDPLEGADLDKWVIGEGGMTLKRVALANQMEAAHEEMKAVERGE